MGIFIKSEEEKKQADFEAGREHGRKGGSPRGGIFDNLADMVTGGPTERQKAWDAGVHKGLEERRQGKK